VPARKTKKIMASQSTPPLGSFRLTLQFRTGIANSRFELASLQSGSPPTSIRPSPSLSIPSLQAPTTLPGFDGSALRVAAVEPDVCFVEEKPRVSEYVRGEEAKQGVGADASGPAQQPGEPKLTPPSSEAPPNL